MHKAGLEIKEIIEEYKQALKALVTLSLFQRIFER